MKQACDEVLTDILVGFEQVYHIAPTAERIEALHEAIEIIHKYQKIKQIVETDLSFPGDVQLEEIFKVINGYESFLFDREEKMTNLEKLTELGIHVEPEGGGSNRYFLVVDENWLYSEYGKKEKTNVDQT